MPTTTNMKDFARTLREAGEAIADLGGEITTVNFDPNDPASIEAAIAEMEYKVDERVRRYANNPVVAQLVGEAKAKYRQGILDQAAAARASRASED